MTNIELPRRINNNASPEYLATAAHAEYEAWRHLASGERALLVPGALESEAWYAFRRVALFAHTFSPILQNGDYRSDRPGTYSDDPYRPLRVSETTTKQQGSIVWIDNPDETHTAAGSVAPFLPQVTLRARTLFPYVHDVPFGGDAPNYLGAYAALVKSDAYVLTAHIREDPHEGLRVYVYGEPGEQHEIVLFHGSGRGEAQTVTFAADAPLVYPVGPSQIVALTPRMAARTWFPDEIGAPVLIGPDEVLDHRTVEAEVEVAPGRPHTLFALYADGTLGELSVEAPPPEPRRRETFDFDDADWQEWDAAATEGAPPGVGWYRAVMTSDEAMDAQLETNSGSAALWFNGERLTGKGPFDVRLRDGANVICTFTAEPAPVTLSPTGTCFLVEVRRWRFHPENEGVRVRVAL